MRLILVGMVVFFGSIVGCTAIESVSRIQEAKTQRLCESIPNSSSFDSICRKYKHQSTLSD